jgi:WhiB family redox-sensing transcriptional regulator
VTSKGSEFLDRLGFQPAWFAQAACSLETADLFFPATGESRQPAKNVCGGCPVAEECLQYAVDEDIPYGTWGGKTAGQRSRTRLAGPRRRRQRDNCMKGLHPMTGSNVRILGDGKRACDACYRARAADRNAQVAFVTRGGTP